MKKLLITLAVLLGIGFIILAIVYWTTAAGSLPTYVPGFENGVTTVHFKHGLASLLLAFALFAYVWFASGKKSANN